MERPWHFVTDSKSDAYCRMITAEMMRLFGMTEEEAIGRINRAWSHHKEFVPVIYHDSPIDRQANTIYFGHDSSWWINDEAVRERLGLAPVEPLPYP